MSQQAPDTDPSSRPLRTPSALTYAVRDEAVVAGGKRSKLFALNPTARAVWELCDGRHTISEIVQQLAQEYDAAPNEVSEGVHAIVGDLRAKKALILKEPTSRAAANGQAATFFVTFLDHYVEVYVDIPRLAKAFKRSMGETFGSGQGICAGRIEVYPHDDGYRVRGNRGSEKIVEGTTDAVTWMRRRSNWLLIRARPDLLWFHAGATAKGGGAMLCAGDYGSGKSTLVTGLYQAGWSYFTDDVLPYDPATGCVLPYPHTPSYRQGGDAILSPDELPTLRRKRTLLEKARIAAQPVPLRLMVFPTFQPHAVAAPSERSPASTVVKLTKHCFNLDTYRGDPVHALSALAERVPAYDVEHNAEAPVYERVEQLWPDATDD